MDPSRAREILRALADGRDPATGAPFPPDSPYQQADTVRALHAALEALSATSLQPTASSLPPSPGNLTSDIRPLTSSPHPAPARWTPEEEQRLRDAFAAQTPIPAIAATHNRTRGAITSRLIRLGLIQDDFAHPARPPTAPPDRQTAPPADRPPPRPPNPKPDDDLPF